MQLKEENKENITEQKELLKDNITLKKVVHNPQAITTKQ